MGSCRDLASADEPLSRGPEPEESVPDQLTCEEAAQASPDSAANAGQVSSCQGTEGDLSAGHCDNTGSPVLGGDFQCTENGEFETQSKAEASDLGKEGLSSEVRVGSLQNGDEMAMKLKEQIASPGNPSDQIEVEDGKYEDGPLLNGIDLVEGTADGLLVMEADPEVNPPSIIAGGECHSEMEATKESKLISEEVLSMRGGCSLDSCANPVDEKVNDVAEPETGACNMTSCPESSDLPTEDVLSSSYPDEKSTKHEQKNPSRLPIETLEHAVEAIHIGDTNSLILPSNETSNAADNSFHAGSACHAVSQTVQGNDRSFKCLTLKEASAETMRDASSEVEAEMCIETLSFGVNAISVEENTIDTLLLDHEQMRNENAAMTISYLVNETNAGDRVEADSWDGTSISGLHEMPYEQSGMPDPKQLPVKKNGGLFCGMPDDMFSGSKDVEIDEMYAHILSSADDQGMCEGLHISSPLSNSAQVDLRENSNEAAETNVEHFKEENARPLDKYCETLTKSLHFKEIAFDSENLSEGSLHLRSCEPHSTVKNCSSKSQSDFDVRSMIVAAATTSSAADDYTSENSNERKHEGRSQCVPEIESPIVMTSSSRRSSRVHKSGRKTQAKGGSRNGSKVAQHQEALELIFKAAKKKRTCCSKIPRSSTWGGMQNVSQHFEHKDELVTEPSQRPGSRKIRIGRGSGKQIRNGSGGTSQDSKGDAGSSSNRIRLKVRMGNEVVMISEIANNRASLGTFASGSRAGTISDVANLSNDIKEKNQLDCLGAKLDNGELSHGDPLANEYPNVTAKESVQGGSCFDPTVVEIGSVGATVEDRYLGSETSPDSEVINLMPEAQVGDRHQEGVNGTALDSSKSLPTCEDVLDFRKGKKKDKVPHQGSFGRKGKPILESSSSKRRGGKVKVDESFNSGENFVLLASANRLSNSTSQTESLPLPNESDLAFFKGDFNIESGGNTYSAQDSTIGSMNIDHLKNDLLSSAKKKGQKQVKSSNSGRGSADRSREVNSTKGRKGASCKQKKDSEKSSSKSKVKEKVDYNQLPCTGKDQALSGNGGRDGDQKSNTAAYALTGCGSKTEIISTILEQQLAPSNAWVRCDECHKWRRIAAALADSIEDANSTWTCKDNLDKRFAGCSIPQEMSNADINAELEISDYSCEEDDCDGNRNYKELKSSRPTVPQQSSFIQIDSNKFLHRSRRTQTIDEIMVCHCTPPLDGKLGCGDECLNRMLNIECVQGTCPCGDLCSNQQFQRRKYANLQWFRCGKKGYGLQLLENVRKGDFIIEYVGEVLDVPAYDERQRDYAGKGHKHFYFMTLNGSEVIDACNKGNLGRFINHSCDPNCRTEKWMVNGEICIGLFAIRDIKKGEEVTFNYNYVRVCGAAAKKCVCGSSKCEGYIGGDLQSTETIVQGDSDDEFPEPVMLHENGDVAYRFDKTMPQTAGGSDILTTDLLLKNEDEMMMIKDLENSLGSKDPQSDPISCISQSDKSLDVEGRAGEAVPVKPLGKLSVHSKDVKTMSSPDFGRRISIEEDTSKFNCTDPHGMGQPAGKFVSDVKRDLLQLRPLVKTPRSSSTVKKGKGSSNSQNVNKGHGMASKSPTVSVKPKKAIEGSSNGRFEAVQEKLNELLDADGGISKRKDAPKGYLKLLLLTAASGDSGNGEAIQSNRDLSMILDALLKTRSRLVLMDIINKNGLRMLHNILKQYRRNFKKIPILRKLLKVLEYLAVREILTLEHIIVGPPCPGMESLRESILSLTEHDDKQVHQIARNFRDRWIPRHLRKVGLSDRDDGVNRGVNFNFLSSHSNWRDMGLTRPVEATDSLHHPSISATTSSATDNSSIDGGSTSGNRARKRKTRWDSDTNPYLESLKRKEDSLSRVEDGKESNCEEEGPPGFSSPLDTSRVSSNSSSTAAAVDQSSEKVQYLRCPFDAVIGQPQERFKSQLPVSYGVPLLILQQFGTPQAGSTESWAIAPGMAFHPFPPLPPFPRDRKRRSPPSSSDCGTNSSSSLHSSADEKKHENLSPSTTSASLAESEVPCSENQQMMMPFKRLKGSSQDLGRRYFKQQKWNSTKVPPPWVRNGWRNNPPRGGPGPVPNEQRSSESAVDCKVGRDMPMPPVQDHHH